MLALTGFYLAFAFFYALILEFSSGEFDSISWRIIYLDYPLKAIFTLPVWWLLFRRLAALSLTERVLLTLVLMPLWVKGWQQTYYFIVEKFGNGWHLRGGAEWWDIYIPALFYCIQFGIFFALEYYHNFRRSLLEKAEAERLLLSSELAALRAQLNPHFLYNAFNTISASVPPGQEETREMIARLSDLFRHRLRTEKCERITLADEVTFIRDYLELERARLGDRLHFRIELSPGTEGAAVPPLILQPLVENAIKHGIAPRLEGGAITVSASGRADVLRLMVTDNGAGFEHEAQTAGHGVGLQNVNRRLELLYGTQLQIDSRPGQTSVSLEIPRTDVHQDRPDRRRSPRPQITERIPG